ncbi:hypothetical protein MRBLMR1_000207 [Neorhizobium sp. LMR1-1-1.1]|jgi:hypothetical protein
MTNPVFIGAASPLFAVAGIYLLVRCISRLWKIISPKVKYRFPAGSTPYRMNLPIAGRYVVSVVIPAMTFITGVSYFSARFSITQQPSGVELDYRSYGRSLFRTERTDMSGRKSFPLGAFECPTPGDFEITCVNPETIRESFQLEVSPHVPGLYLVALILATILSSFMAIGGFVFCILWLAGKL